MTNAELLAKIKAEIERLMECVGKASRELKDFTPYMDGELSAYEDILDFLSDLEESKESVPKDLEEAADEYEKKHTYQRYDGGGLTPEYNATLAESFIAGAEWQAEQLLKSSPLPEDTVLFNKGVEEGKRLMMEEAVEADVMLTLHDKTGDISLHTGYLPKELGIKCDDKVRIIIVKEDEK